MNRPGPLLIASCGGVTSVGLNCAQSFAAIRAGLTNFATVYQRLPIDKPGLGAEIPAAPSLRTDPCSWLANLAARSIRECLDGQEWVGRQTALLWCLPEAPRFEQSFSALREVSLRVRIEARLGVQFSPHSREYEGGPAALVEALGHARELLAKGIIQQAIVGGADSLLGRVELERLHARRRIHGGEQPHGLVPSEGASCVLVAAAASNPLVRIRGLGLAREQHTILGPKLSVGEALLAAIEQASSDASVDEPSIGFVCSNINGERYASWEAIHARMRFFRTRREELPILTPASCAGDLGSASGALALSFAVMALTWGRAPAPRGLLELTSEGALRSACVLEAARGEPTLAPGRLALAQLMG